MVLLLVIFLHTIILPFLVPFFLIGKFEALTTVVDNAGVCIQTTRYTCGPAAAVTALRQLNIQADEGQIAILAYSTPFWGTNGDLLAHAIQKRYESEGILCQYRRFDSVSQLKGNCPAIAVVKFAPLIDHYVTILEVTDNSVHIGDPLEGRQIFTSARFEEKWRFIGILVKREENNASKNP